MLRNMENKRNMTQQRDNNNLLAMDPKDMESWDLLDKGFKIAIWRKLNELQENTGRQFSKLRQQNP